MLVGDVQAGSFCAQNGVSVGCRLVAVNGHSTEGLSTKQVTEMLKNAVKLKEPRILTFSKPAPAAATTLEA